MNCSKLKQVIRSALIEDIGKRDITTELTVPRGTIIKAILLAKEECVVCGLDIARLVFKVQDKRIKFKLNARDGQLVKKGKTLAQIQGNARNILAAERVALNFISLLSGVATKTREYVEAVKPYKVKIIDTRKTIPGLRSLQKYAVRIGGGRNHRMRLDEMVLLKDNHLKILLSLKNLRRPPGKYKLEIEVKNLKEFKEALKLKPDIIMLDNMRLEDIKKAVSVRNNLAGSGYHKKPQLEASGGVNLTNIKRVAACQVDMVSIGALTHSIKSADISLEVL